MPLSEFKDSPMAEDLRDPEFASDYLELALKYSVKGSCSISPKNPNALKKETEELGVNHSGWITLNHFGIKSGLAFKIEIKSFRWAKLLYNLK